MHNQPAPDSTRVGPALAVLLARASARGEKLPCLSYRGLDLTLRPDRSVRVSSRGITLGYVDQTGGLHVDDDCAAALVAGLAADPLRACRDEGRRSGVCCYCNRALTTPESCSVGYGPVCADRWGLPWGSVRPDYSAQPDLFGGPE